MQKIPSIDMIDFAAEPGLEKSVVCSLCSLRFLNEESLKKHQLVIKKSQSEASETTNRRICKLCNHEFATYRGMRQHVGKIHNSVRKVKCKYCSKKFKDNYAVKYHRKQVHDKSTLVKCENCEKVLYNQYSLKKHLEVCQDFRQNQKEIVETEDLRE